MQSMKRAVITGIRQSQLVDCEIPRPKDDWVLVKLHAIPLCTEYKGWLNGYEYRGHEAAGEVVATAQACRVKVGDRVVVMPGSPCGKCTLCVAGDYIHCRHFIDPVQFTGQPFGDDTHVQFMLKQDWLLVPIPEGVSFELASLACCGLGPTFGAMERMQISAFDSVLITGGGPVGLGGVVNAKFRGAKTIMVEGIPYRQEKARSLGADLVLAPDDPAIQEKIFAYTKAEGVSVCVETSGVPAAQRLCLNVVRQKGQVALVGECNDDLVVKASPDFIRKGISLFGQWHYNLNGAKKIMQVISESPVVEQLITHTYGLEQFQEALATCASHQCAKVILQPWG